MSIISTAPDVDKVQLDGTININSYEIFLLNQGN